MTINLDDDARRDQGKRHIRPNVIFLAAVAAVPAAYGLHLLGVVGPIGAWLGYGERPVNHAMPAIHASDTEMDGLRHGPVGAFRTDGPILVDKDGLTIHGCDVIAYFTEGEPMKGSQEYEADHEGATFRFASEEHRDRFVEDPQAFIPAYGGYCTLGVAGDYKDGMHPEAFEIVDGRLFFNLTPSIHQHWQGRMEELIDRADRNWPELKETGRAGPGLGLRGDY